MKKRVKRHAVTQPLDQSYKIIPLTKGKNALVDAVDYDWLNQWNWHTVQKHRGGDFYAARMMRDADGKWIKMPMHRFILGCSPEEQGDHWNGDTLDNRRNNLRRCSHEENQHNQRRNKKNTSGFKGVNWDKFTNRWLVRIKSKGVAKNLGRYDSLEQAARVYDEAAKRIHGAFARLNFPEHRTP